jgi:hypothetical protein
MFKRMASHLWNRIKAIPQEAFDTLCHKVIPQGCAAISQLLNHGHAGYVP